MMTRRPGQDPAPGGARRTSRRSGCSRPRASLMADHGIGGIEVLYAEPLSVRGDRRQGRKLHARCVENIDIGGLGHDPLGGPRTMAMSSALHRPFRPLRRAGGPEGRRDDPGPAPAAGGPRLCPHSGPRRGEISAWPA
ncbi:hypothetical protein ACRAWD_25750 [Caulobacter segnis]